MGVEIALFAFAAPSTKVGNRGKYEIVQAHTSQHRLSNQGEEPNCRIQQLALSRPCGSLSQPHSECQSLMHKLAIAECGGPRSDSEGNDDTVRTGGSVCEGKKLSVICSSLKALVSVNSQQLTLCHYWPWSGPGLEQMWLGSTQLVWTTVHCGVSFYVCGHCEEGLKVWHTYTPL